MSESMDESGRPLSPFLIYRWGVTNSLSILHRITGVGLSVGILVLTCWLLAIATGPEPYASVASFFGATWFKLPLAAWAFCFFYHLANGVRHLFWDAGRGFGHAEIKLGGIAVVLFAIVMTAIYVMIGLV
jgi:succinate dehydrogenase / fumarate reductase cytochrome b subunit